MTCRCISSEPPVRAEVRPGKFAAALFTTEQERRKAMSLHFNIYDSITYDFCSDPATRPWRHRRDDNRALVLTIDQEMLHDGKTADGECGDYEEKDKTSVLESPAGAKFQALQDPV